MNKFIRIFYHTTMLKSDIKMVKLRPCLFSSKWKVVVLSREYNYIYGVVKVYEDHFNASCAFDKIEKDLSQ